MTGRWQDSWTFRIVDQDSGTSVSGVPVAVLDEGGRSAGVWVSDVDATVRIPKHDRPRLRLRVGLHNDEVIELDARSLPDEPVPIVAPRGEEVAQPLPSHPIAVPEHGAGHLLRFARIGVLRQDADVTETAAADRARFVAPADDPGAIRYGVVFEIEQVWQSLGPLGVTPLESERLGGTTVRTVRNMRPDGVLTYHFIEPVESYRVVVRTPRPRPAILVPFRLPNIATRDVVRRFGHALRRALLDRAFLPDIEQGLAPDEPPVATGRLPSR